MRITSMTGVLLASALAIAACGQTTESHVRTGPGQDQSSAAPGSQEDILYFDSAASPVIASVEDLAAAAPIVVVGSPGPVTVNGSSRVDGKDHYRAILTQEFQVDEVLRDDLGDALRTEALRSGKIRILWNGPNPENAQMRTRLNQGTVALDPLGTGVLPDSAKLVLFLEPSALPDLPHLSPQPGPAFMTVGRWQGIAELRNGDSVQAPTLPFLGDLPGMKPDESARLRLAELAKSAEPIAGLAGSSLKNVVATLAAVPYDAKWLAERGEG